MRLIPILALSLALVLAGCFGGGDEAGGEDTPPVETTPTPTTQEEPTEPTPDANETDPVPPAPPAKSLCSTSHDFATAPADPAAAEEPVTEACGTLEEGYSTLTMNVTWALGAPTYVGTEAKVTLLDPAGTPVGSCSGPQAAAQEPPEACELTLTGPATGDWQLQYEGHGSTTAQIAVDVA